MYRSWQKQENGGVTRWTVTRLQCQPLDGQSKHAQDNTNMRLDWRTIQTLPYWWHMLLTFYKSCKNFQDKPVLFLHLLLQVWTPSIFQKNVKQLSIGVTVPSKCVDNASKLNYKIQQNFTCYTYCSITRSNEVVAKLHFVHTTQVSSLCSSNGGQERPPGVHRGSTW